MKITPDKLRMFTRCRALAAAAMNAAAAAEAAATGYALPPPPPPPRKYTIEDVPAALRARLAATLAKISAASAPAENQHPRDGSW